MEGVISSEADETRGEKGGGRLEKTALFGQRVLFIGGKGIKAPNHPPDLNQAASE